jgi:hypothetical protein
MGMDRGGRGGQGRRLFWSAQSREGAGRGGYDMGWKGNASEPCGVVMSQHGAMGQCRGC